MTGNPSLNDRWCNWARSRRSGETFGLGILLAPRKREWSQICAGVPRSALWQSAREQASRVKLQANAAADANSSSSGSSSSSVEESLLTMTVGRLGKRHVTCCASQIACCVQHCHKSHASLDIKLHRRRCLHCCCAGEVTSSDLYNVAARLHQIIT